jgi:hypothetical protein
MWHGRSIGGTRRGTAGQVEGTQAVLSSEYYYDAGNLLVFARDGEVVRAVTVLPDLLATGGQSRWSHDVRLEPQGKRTPAVLRLVEPAP